MSPSPSCSDGSSSKLARPFSPAFRLRPLSSRWSKCADRPVPAFVCDKGAPCCCCWGCCVEVAPKREEVCPSPLVCVGFEAWFAVVDCCVWPPRPPKRLLVCACGCAVDAPPKRPPAEAVEAGAGDADGFAPPNAPPNRLPPKPPLLAGCVVPVAAPEVAPPNPPNKLVGAAADVPAGLLPNKDPNVDVEVGAALAAG